MHLLYTYVTYLTILLTIADGYVHAVLLQESNQYFTQDDYGQYSYGYNAPHSIKQETRTFDGVTRGSYSYLDATGKWQTVQYIADANGFHVVGTNLPQNDLQAPQPVTDTIEVAEARARHLAAHEQIRMGTSSPLVKSYTNGIDNASSLPQPVQDTAEVAAAKEEFFKRYEEERQRHKSMRVILSAPLTATLANN